MEMGSNTLLWEDREWQNHDGPVLDSLPIHPTDIRLWAVMAALRRNVAPEEMARRTGIDPWFLYRLSNIVDMERRLLKEDLTPRLLWEAKRLGFSDVQIATLGDRLPEQVRQLRRDGG